MDHLDIHGQPACVQISKDLNSYDISCLCGRMDKAMVIWSVHHKFESRRAWDTCTIHFWTQMLASVAGLGCFTQPGLLGLVSTPGPPKFISLRRLITAGSAIILPTAQFPTWWDKNIGFTQSKAAAQRLAGAFEVQIYFALWRPPFPCWRKSIRSI